MSDSPQLIAGVRMAGRPDLLYFHMAAGQARAGEHVSIHTEAGVVPGCVVIAADQLVAGRDDVGSVVAGSLELREGELVAILPGGPAEPPARHIGAAVSGPSQPDIGRSIDVLFRAYESPGPRLGSRIETGDGAGVVVALDRARGVFVVELDSGGTVDVASKQQ